MRAPRRTLTCVLAMSLAVGLSVAPTASCTTPVSVLQQAAWAIAEAWPTAGAARDDEDVLVEQGVWYWTHGRTSVEGFGVTLVVLDAAPGVDAIWDKLNHVEDGIGLERPNLLFFDPRGEDWRDWPLIGFGYTVHYVPCWTPALDGLTAEQWFVHEGGYHHVPIGDGGMTLATDDDLRRDAASESVDRHGCEPLYTEDLRVKVDKVRHGRMWVTHVWLDPEGGEPVVGVTDPWQRWTDDPDRVRIDGKVFFYPEPEACDCVVAPPPRRGCG